MNRFDIITKSYSWVMPNVTFKDPFLTAKGKTTQFMNDFTKSRGVSKPMAQWSPPEVREWLCEEALKHNYDYEKIDLSCFRDVNGETLLNMTIDDFEKKDKESGHFLFEIVTQYIINEEIKQTGNFLIDDKYRIGTKFIMNGIDTRTHKLSLHMSNMALQNPPLTAKGKTTKLMNDFLKLGEVSKPMTHWSPPEVRGWICEEALRHNYDYEKIDLSCFHDVNGETLLNMTKDDFQKRDKECGGFLFKIVKQHSKNKKSQRKGRRPLATNEAGHQIKRNRRKKCCSVLEFIQSLLKDPAYCPRIICWENYEKGIFRFVQNNEVAKIWGDIKGNPSMNFEKLSRAIRYYYGKNIFQSVRGKLIYAFGERATGWRTDDPNFRNSCK